MTCPEDYTERQWEEAHTVWILGRHFDETGKFNGGKYSALVHIIHEIYTALKNDSDFKPDQTMLDKLEPKMLPQLNDNALKLIEEIVEKTVAMMKEKQ